MAGALFLPTGGNAMSVAELRPAAAPGAIPTAEELVEFTSLVPVSSRPMPMTSRMSSSRYV